MPSWRRAMPKAGFSASAQAKVCAAGGGSSPIDGSIALRAREARYAEACFDVLTGEIFG